MSQKATSYVLSIIVIAGVVMALSLSASVQLSTEWPLLLVLVVLTSIAHLYMSATPSHEAWGVNLVFLSAGVVLLNTFDFGLLVIIPHFIEWGYEVWIRKSTRLRNWYIQPFNIAVHLIAGFIARTLFLALNQGESNLASIAAFLAAAVAMVGYLIVNHLLVGYVLVFARGVTLRKSGVFEPGNLIGDLTQVGLGYVVAVVWQINPVLMLPTLAPLLLIFRALQVPKLTKEAQTDAKTGLWNTRHFNEVFSAELARARRFERPLAVVMADLDLLRNINNTYGHLAGDAVLAGIGQIIRRGIRDYDLAARFGGEEFSIVLLEAEVEAARTFADRIRQTIEQTEFVVPSSPTPIHVTMSLGVACYPGDAATTTDLIQLADVAVYQAKLHGRNRVVCAADVPESIKLANEAAVDQLATAYQAALLPRSVSSPPIDPASSQAPPRLPESNATRVFVGSVLALGLLVAGLGLAFDPHEIDLRQLGLLVVLAVAGELLQVSIYGLSTMSVSVAVNFAAALIAGTPGVILVSAAIVLVHYLKVRPALYQTAFNWATHLLAAALPVFVIRLNSDVLTTTNLAMTGALIVVTSLGYFLIETGLVATAIALAKRTSLYATWTAQFRWLLSHYLVLCVMGAFLAVAHQALGLSGLVVFTLPPFMMHYVQKQYIARTQDSMHELQRLNKELTRANQEIVAANRAIQDLNNELFVILAKIVDARDPYVTSHTSKVAEYAVAVAAELGLPRARVDAIRQAALLHDIGKIGISEQILHKPDRLTADEYLAIKRHPVLGAELLETCQGLRHLVPAVKYHHEWYDGRGYPEQLQGEAIPLEARILAVCDAVEAMASDRPYHRARTLDQIVAELRRCAGTQFDPAMVEAFAQVIRRRGDSFVVNSARGVGAGEAPPEENVRPNQDSTAQPRPGLSVVDLARAKLLAREAGA